MAKSHKQRQGCRKLQGTKKGYALRPITTALAVVLGLTHCEEKDGVCWSCSWILRQRRGCGKLRVGVGVRVGTYGLCLRPRNEAEAMTKLLRKKMASIGVVVEVLRQRQGCRKLRGDNGGSAVCA